MDKVTLFWNDGVIQYSQIGNFNNQILDQSGFYMILSANYNSESKKYYLDKLLYIGQAYEQTFKERIIQKHPAYTCVNKYLKDNNKIPVIKIGIISNSTQQNITQQLFDDIECCLIFKNKPLCNDKCKNKYSGRELNITNKGNYFPLIESTVCNGTPLSLKDIFNIE